MQHSYPAYRDPREPRRSPSPPIHADLADMGQVPSVAPARPDGPGTSNPPWDMARTARHAPGPLVSAPSPSDAPAA